MSLDHIRNAVAEKARAEAQAVEAEAQKDAAQRVEAARRAIEEEFERRLDSDRQAAEQEAQRGVIQRRSEHNLELLRKRNAILDGLLEQAARRTTEMPDEQYCAIVGQWMANRIPANAGGEVLCTRRDLERLRPVVEKLNAGRPPDAQLRLAEHEDAPAAGVLFRGEQFEVDLSVEAMTARLRESLAPELSRLLFPGDMTV